MADRDAIRERLSRWKAGDDSIAAADLAADVDALLSEVSVLTARLDFERNPSTHNQRQGHHRRCARVVFPRSLLPCTCAEWRGREIEQARRWAEGRCPDYRLGLRQPNQYDFCDGRLFAYVHAGWPDEEWRKCATCWTIFRVSDHVAKEGDNNG